jgi:hypothetical protein
MKSKTTKIATAKELAGRLKRSKAAISAWMKRDDWTFGVPPWTERQFKAIQAFALGLRAGGAAEADPQMEAMRKEKLRAEVRRLASQANLEELKLSQLCSTLIDADEVRTEWAAIRQLFESRLDSMRREITQLAIANKLPREAEADFSAGVVALLNAVVARLDPTTGSDEPKDDR